ncbi:FimB/Mfa2 family fimbrial subunit [Alistipes sp. OttesenSCG-928-B03]|nr:FimB/Mfa2 family fimbrial subunit [Alistipes sp. OttesenSCG-928-B03]
MSKQLIRLFLVTIPLLWGSCAPIHEDLDRCEIYLEFVYDYNLEYTDSFIANVETVDVFVFDNEGKFLFTKHADCATELIDGKRMSLAGELKFGIYRVLTVGGLSESFSFADRAGEDFVPNVTTIEEATLRLKRKSNIHDGEFEPLWFGEEVVVKYLPEQIEDKVYDVDLIKDTNVFNFVLYRQDAPNGEIPTYDGRPNGMVPPYTFEIVTPEGAVYGHNNEPITTESLRYTAYKLSPGVTENSYAVGSVNTVRLMDAYVKGQDSGYRLVVRNRRTLKEAWNIDLMELLTEMNWGYDQYRFADMQEFLDRKSVWDIIIRHQGGGPDEEHDAFIGLAIQIGPWIKWYTDMPL